MTFSGILPRRKLRRAKAALFIFASTLLFTTPGCGASYTPSTIIPPKPLREFRGVWVATVANIDWPSRRGLSTAEQKKELVSILDRAVQLKLNAIIFQVRPACDAMYASKIEPWSEYLTGTMGRAPDPYYDPLAFAIEEAHKRGLELHAWFNPYRALHKSHEGPISPNHISRTHPEFVKKYGPYLWLDPGERDVQDYSLKVVMDVVKRYDIDGVHFDDYFYPYVEKDSSGQDIDFPDEASWKKFGERGKLNRVDWRRENVNAFIERAYHSIKATKPWVQFGVSPFGIWRPGNPPQIKGYDSYARLYADSRKWLEKGWLDYLAPQLYWPIHPEEQSFPVLLGWWASQNSQHREVYAGIASANAAKWRPDEVPQQIQITRRLSGASGYVFWNMSSLMSDSPFTKALKHEVNVSPALPPVARSSDPDPPGKPRFFLGGQSSGNLRLIFSAAKNSTAKAWLIQTRTGEVWKTEILPGSTTIKKLGRVQPDVIAVTEVDRFNNTSKPAVFQRKR